MSNEITLNKSVTVNITAPKEVSTLQLLTIAQRLLAETPDLDTVMIWKPAATLEGKSIYVIVGRKENGIGYTESWTVA